MDMKNRKGDINLGLGIDISTNTLHRKKSLLGNHKADRTYHASSSSCFGQLGPRPSWSRRLRPDASGDPNRNTNTNTNTIRKHKQLQKQLEHEVNESILVNIYLRDPYGNFHFWHNKGNFSCKAPFYDL